jgi:hypothetical protein
MDIKIEKRKPIFLVSADSNADIIRNLEIKAKSYNFIIKCSRLDDNVKPETPKSKEFILRGKTEKEFEEKIRTFCLTVLNALIEKYQLYRREEREAVQWCQDFRKIFIRDVTTDKYVLIDPNYSLTKLINLLNNDLSNHKDPIINKIEFHAYRYV